MHATIYPASYCMEKMVKATTSSENDAKSTQFYLWLHLFLGPASGVDHLTRSIVFSIIIG
jgi:hypothetical protein